MCVCVHVDMCVAGYPIDKESLGIGSVLDQRNGKYVYLLNNAGPNQVPPAARSLGLVATGPSPAAWRTFLLSTMQNKKRSRRMEEDDNEGSGRRRVLQRTVNFSSPAVEEAPPEAQVDTAIDKLQGALDSVGTATAKQVTTTKATKKGPANKRGATAAAATTTSLSSSYIQNSGGEGGSTMFGSEGVRASLLSVSAPPPPPPEA